MTKVSVARIFTPTADVPSTFFSILLEMPDINAAIIIDGFRYLDGKIYPPSKPVRKQFYSTVLLSPEFAKLVAIALRDAGFKDPELDADSGVSAKWGQNSLAHHFENDADVEALWKAYRSR